MFSIHSYDKIESLINYHYSEAEDSLASYTIGMEVGDWSNAGRKSGLFSVHPAVTSDYVWNLFGSPTKLKIQSNKVVLRTVYISKTNFIQVIVVKYATCIRSIIPRSSDYRTICG